MNDLQLKIQERSKAWADCWCCETRDNGGNCIDDVTQRFTGNKAWRVEYCAITGWVVYAEACLELGLTPLLPRVAGARRMLDESSKHPVLKNYISKDPVPGATFYRKTSASGSRNGSEVSGHIGTVYQVTDDRLIAFEGNSGKQIRFVSYSLTDVANPNRGFMFIHACLAPHSPYYKVVFLMPGVPTVMPWREKAADPAGCRTVTKCKPKKSVV